MTDCITLVASNGQEFIVLKEVAQISPVIRSSQGFEEGQTGRVELDMEWDVLEVIVNYMYYNYKYKEVDTGSIPEFNIPTHLTLDLLVEADYLEL